MTTIAVVAHSGKSFGGGLAELREVLAREGFPDPLWYEVKKSRKAPKYARRAMAHGADVIFVRGGDGTVQRCIDAVAGTGPSWRSCQRGQRICWHRTWRSQPTSLRRFRSAC
jgi:diacylglycerol kinase (ATP)